MTNSLKHSPHLTVTPLRQRYFVPAISTFAASGFQRGELGIPVFQSDPFKQALFLFVVQSTENSNRVLSLKSKAWMHQAVSKLT
jgi:hypothetical protein